MKTLRTMLLGATCLISALGAAQAADPYGRDSLKDGPAHMPPIVWTGLYLGLHFGSTAIDEGNIKIDGEDWGTVESESAFLFGTHIGYNLQTSGDLVLGIEGDITGSGADAINMLATLRGRAGLAMDKSLIYVTAGVAYLDWDFGVGVADAAFDSSTGWVVGAGYEQKITNNLSVGIEGLYYSFSDKDDLVDLVEIERDIWTIRTRVNYHLGGGRDALK